MNPLFATISVSFITLILALLSIVYVTFIFVQDLPMTLAIYIRSFEMAFKKKEREKAIDETTTFLNDFFRNAFNEIITMSNEELSQKLNVSEKEAKQFKNEVKNTLNKKM